MAEGSYLTHHHQISGKTVALTTLAGLVIGGPLLALMGFCFLATGTLFLVTSPLLLIFSPLLLGACFVFMSALAGFGAATVMAIAGLSSFGWVLRSYGGGQRFSGLIQVVDKAKEGEGYLDHENWPDRG